MSLRLSAARGAGGFACRPIFTNLLSISKSFGEPIALTPAMEKTSEAELIADSKQGGQRAIAELVGRH